MSSQPPHLRDLTNVKFEIFIAAFTILPFFILAYFYSEIPNRVPLFLNLTGEVATWTGKGLISVFRVPLMGLAMQIVFLLMKYGTVQSGTFSSAAIDGEQATLKEQCLRLNARLWDWFRGAAAFKMSAESISTIFLSVDRFNFLAQSTFVFSAIASLFGAIGALYYLYRLLVARRELKARFGDELRPVDKQYVYARLFYFNPSDPTLFVNKYLFNFANKWTWVFLACILSYPLLVFVLE
jgi:uncharacterized membrane protein